MMNSVKLFISKFLFASKFRIHLFAKFQFHFFTEEEDVVEKNSNDNDSEKWVSDDEANF